MSFKPLRAMIGTIAGITSLYVIYGTFGTALMVFKTAGEAQVPLLKMAPAWKAIAIFALNNFDYWFSSVWVVGVALIVYLVLSSITSTDYDRMPQG